MKGPATAPASLQARAFEEGVIWAQSPYYDLAETGMVSRWRGHIWPMIQDCDFSHVVDLAAGHGRNSQMLRSVADRITVVDINQENVDFCKGRFAGDPKFRFIKNDGCTLADLEDNSVSLLYCFDAMVHFDSDVVRSYLREFHRVLQPGGRGFCHHSNYTGNPCGDFRDDGSWRNFMSQELFHHYCDKEQLSVLRAMAIDWAHTPHHDCLTLFEKPRGGLAAKELVMVEVHQAGDPAKVARRHLRAQLLSPATDSCGPTAGLHDGYSNCLQVCPSSPSPDTPTVVSLDTSSWHRQGVQLQGVSAEVAVLGEQPSHPVVCRIELRGGEGGTGDTLAHAETTITSRHGWVRLHAALPPGERSPDARWALRYLLRRKPVAVVAPPRWPSLLFLTRMADGAVNAYYAWATFRNIQIHTGG